MKRLLEPSPVYIFPDILGMAYPVQEKDKKSMKQNSLVKQDEKKKKLVKLNPTFKQENVKKKCPAVEKSQKKEKPKACDTIDTDSQNRVHITRKDFTVLIKLRKNYKNENGLIEYSCQMCQDKHYSEESFTRHWYLHTVCDPRVICMVCGQTIKKRRKLRSHLAEKHASHPYSCSACSLIFKGPYEDKCHRFGHAQKCKYFCSICGIGFDVFHVLEFHMFTNHVEGCKSMYSIDQDLVNTFFVKVESIGV